MDIIWTFGRLAYQKLHPMLRENVLHKGRGIRFLPPEVPSQFFFLYKYNEKYCKKYCKNTTFHFEGAKTVI